MNIHLYTDFIIMHDLTFYFTHYQLCVPQYLGQCLEYLGYIILTQACQFNQITVVPRSYATPSYAKFPATLFWIETKKTQFYFLQVTIFFLPIYIIFFFFPPVTLFSAFSPQLRYLLFFKGKNSVAGGKNTKIAQDIY